MEDNLVEQFAFTNLPSNKCALTNRHTDDPVVLHRDLSDFWDESLNDIRDERLVNLIIVDRKARDHYYAKLKNMQCVLSLSGGLDSTTVLYWARNLFGSVHCLLFDYGQRHKIELEVAETNLHKSGMLKQNVTYDKIKMDCISALGDSALTRENIKVPLNRNVDQMGEGIPVTFVPGRNLYFLTALAQAAYIKGGRHIAIGVNVLDYSGYPDCRPQFLTYMREAIKIGVFNGQDIGLHAPLMLMAKDAIIRLGLSLGVDYSMTYSCYTGLPVPCGQCDSCILRQGAFKKLGMTDPMVLACGQALQSKSVMTFDTIGNLENGPLPTNEDIRKAHEHAQSIAGIVYPKHPKY